MNEHLYQQFADALLALVPTFPMGPGEIAALVRTQGLETFVLIADEYDPGIAEIVEILIRHGKGGAARGPG